MEVIIMASSKKEALKIQLKEHPGYVFDSVYKRASKGNSFYKFRKETYPYMKEVEPHIKDFRNTLKQFVEKK